MSQETHKKTAPNKAWCVLKVIPSASASAGSPCRGQAAQALRRVQRGGWLVTGSPTAMAARSSIYHERKIMAILPNTRVWRYMSFAKFVTVLLDKQLWLSCANLLDDRWEVMPNNQQIKAIFSKHSSSKTFEISRDTIAKNVKELRQNTFINCWSASEHESLALWRIYCPSSEGVAIQTTFERLVKSVSLPVLEVKYNVTDVEKPLDALTLATQKRPMFAFEQEVRIVLVQDFNDSPNRTTIGASIDWDPELHIENVWIHPDAPIWFPETVTETVRRLAPKLSQDGFTNVFFSKMSDAPPF
ncbi:MAG: hypothetical protein ACOYYU_01325 [Chloroflexota bacterium]